MGSNGTATATVSATAQAQVPVPVAASAAPAAMAAATTASRRTGAEHRVAPRARADAARNRERIVAAARESFVVHGADGPLDEIARCAGVGNATLYRHFPDRDALVHAVVLAVMERVTGRALAAIEEDTGEPGSAFESLCRYVFGAVEERVGALCPMLSARFDAADPELLTARERLESLTSELIDRAQRAGEVRADVATGDVMVAISHLTRPLPGSGCAETERFVNRHVQLFLDGLRAPARSELPGHAATLEELRHRS